MGKIDITELSLYRWRYFIGYGLVAIGLIIVLIFSSLYSPGGISYQEMQSVIKSGSINHTDLSSIAITNLPYHLLQQASIAIFGVSIISIKLPSIILAFLSAVGIILLLRRWFSPKIGVLASLIAITTGQFLFIAQDGTSGILYLFWSVWLLLLASLVLYQQKLRAVFIMTFCVLAALSLYTPLSIYALIAMISAILLHPHLRYLIRQIPRIQLLIGAIVVLILIIPIILTLVKTPSASLSLLGIPTKWPDFGANLLSLGAQYLGFNKPGGTTLMTPFFELGSMLIIALGVHRVIKTKATAKSYVVIIWILCLTPVIIFNPDFTSITYLPLVLLLASGLSALLTRWYSIFPHNPYARVGGLIPIVILVTVLVFSGADRYIYGYTYDPNIAPNFSKDLSLLPKDTKNIVVTDDELAFYKVVATYNKNLNLSLLPIGDTFAATHAAKQSFSGYRIDRIITTSNYNQSDRFYLYKKITD